MMLDEPLPASIATCNVLMDLMMLRWHMGPDPALCGIVTASAYRVIFRKHYGWIRLFRTGNRAGGVA